MSSSRSRSATASGTCRAIQAYLPSSHLSIAVTTTDGPGTTPNVNYAQTIASSIAAYLAASNPLS